jgi:putative hydrolase of the HAD superfamily
MRYTHLFFDLDHTLWDFEKNSEEAMCDAFKELKIGEFLEVDFETFEPVYKKINMQYWDRYSKGLISRSDLRWKRMQATFLAFKKFDDALSVKLGDIYLEILPTKTHLFPHTIDVLAYLIEERYELHLITNGFEETQKQKITCAGLDSFFGEMISSERAFSAKPQAAIYQFAMQLTKASTEKSLMIGDNFEVDILGAQNVGMDQVYFNPEKKQTQGKATYEIDCLSSLYKIL